MGGERGLKERTISLTDLAWVIVAADDTAEHGGILDEERVNALRYLEGTPKESTRWIDTAWAIAAWNAARAHIKDPIAGETALHKIRQEDGTVLDASFRVERVGDTWSIVYESRGGTRGSAAERNTDYTEGLQLLLQRLREAGIEIRDILVETRDTERIPDAERRLDVGEAYPIRVGDVEELQRRVSAAQAKVGRAPGAKGGGNRTKRLRLFLAADTRGQAEIAALISGG